MKIFFFRHGEKQNDFNSDPQLTVRGHQQAQKIAQSVQLGLLPQPQRLFASPAVRAQQTLLPLSKFLLLPLVTDPRLEQRSVHESSTDFHHRIQSFLQFLTTPPTEADCIFFVSHVDWLTDSLDLLPKTKNISRVELSHWRPAMYAYFQFTNGTFELQDVKNV